MDLNDLIKNGQDDGKSGDVTVRSSDEKSGDEGKSTGGETKDDKKKSDEDMVKNEKAGKKSAEPGKNDSGKTQDDKAKVSSSADEDKTIGGSDSEHVGIRTEDAVKNNDIPSTWKILTEKTRRWFQLPSTLNVIKKYTDKVNVKNGTFV